MKNLRRRAIRGGLAKVLGQAANFVIRLAFVIIMARLLSHEDFGLVAMVTVVTGVFDLFTTAGLSLATVQSQSINKQQLSTLFWINMLVGVVLAVLCLAVAPVLVNFYGEPRLFWIAIAISAGFLFTAAGVQHHAVLERELRYVSIAAIEMTANVIGVSVAIVMGLTGYGYWSLVASAICAPLVLTTLMWVVTGWIPGLPRRDSGVKAMVSYGASATLNGLVVYIAYNLDKVLLGRYWGADILGVYSRAYQLITIPTNNLNQAVGGVAIASLSRLQDNPAQLRNYFLKGYSLVLSLTMPTTFYFAFFSHDIMLVVLGPNWSEADDIFRYLAPTILIFGIINPTFWLLMTIGKQRRSLHTAFVIAPLVTVAYLIGLPYGAKGVAIAFSTAMGLWLVPHVLWCLHGTMVRPLDMFKAVSKPLMSCVAAIGVVLAVGTLYGELQPIMRLLVEGIIMGSVYILMLLFVFGQKAFFLSLLRGLKSPDAAD